MPALLNAAEVFAFPSEFEGFGLPPLEAMACGIPVVCSDAASLPEVVGDAGMVVPPRDVKAWVQAIDRLLGDPTLRAGFGARGSPARVGSAGARPPIARSRSTGRSSPRLAPEGREVVHRAGEARASSVRLDALRLRATAAEGIRTEPGCRDQGDLPRGRSRHLAELDPGRYWATTWASSSCPRV